MSALLTTRQTAERLAITTATVILYAKAGKLPASFIAQKWRFQADDIDAFVKATRRTH